MKLVSASSLCRLMALAAAMAVSPVLGQNLVQNPSFESGTTGPTSWTSNGAEWIAGNWFGSAGPRTGNRFMGAASNGGIKTVSVTQSIGLPLGPTTYNLTLSYWGKIFDIGGDTDTIQGQIIVDGTVRATVNMTNADGLDTYVNKTVNWVGVANTNITVRINLTANGSGAGGNWGVVCVDDVELLGGSPTQHTLTGITPKIIPGNASDTNATVTGINLTGVTALRLVQGATTLTGSALVIDPSGLSATVTFPTGGAPFGAYSVVAVKPGETNAQLPHGFFIRDPSSNILVNGDFELGNLTGWSIWNSDWGGNPAIGSNYVGGLADVFIHQPSDGGTPRAAFGSFSYRCGEIDGGGGEGGIVQVVDVIPGETLLLSWIWGGGSQIKLSAFEVGIMSGARTTAWNQPGNAYLGTVRYENNNDPPKSDLQFGWETKSITVQVPENVTQVTVYTRTWHLPQEAQAIALWIDDVSLRADVVCPDQHTLTGVLPAVLDPEQNGVLTITGTNLQAVTGLRLVRGQDQYLPQDNTWSTSGDGTSIVASFAVPPNGFVLGTYDLVTEQAGCPGGMLPQAVAFICSPISFAGLSINSLEKPQGVVRMTVIGTNVDLLDQVKLVYTPAVRVPPGDRAPYWVPKTEVTGVMIDDSNPDAVVMEFDLLNGQAGKYKLVGVRNSTCPTIELPDAFELTIPAFARNLLINGDFETGYPHPWTFTPEDGITDKGTPFPGPEVAFAPGDGPSWYGHHPYGGDYMAGIRATNDGSWDNWLTPNRGYMRQSVGLPFGPGQYALTMTFQLRIWDQLNGPVGTIASIIVDDLVVSSVTAEMVDQPMTEDGLDPYTLISVDFIGNAAQDITVEFYVYTRAGGGWAPVSSVVIDDVALLTPAGCSTPFADADGDGDVDQIDFAFVQECITTGRTVYEPLSDACRCFDRNLDGYVDQQDLAAFVNCGTGPAILWVDDPNPLCEEQP